MKLALTGGRVAAFVQTGAEVRAHLWVQRVDAQRRAAIRFAPLPIVAREVYDRATEERIDRGRVDSDARIGRFEGRVVALRYRRGFDQSGQSRFCFRVQGECVSRGAELLDGFGRIGARGRERAPGVRVARPSSE